MNQLISYSSSPTDIELLQQLDKYVQQLTASQKAALAMVALYETTTGENISFDYELEGGCLLTTSVHLILSLSKSGKLAVTRAIAEELAVLEQLLEVKL